MKVTDYVSLGYERLHMKLSELLKDTQKASEPSAGKQQRLLPALPAMKSLTSQPGRRMPLPRRPTWSKECELLGICEGTVRQWQHRTGTQRHFRELLGQAAVRSKPFPHMSANHKRLLLLAEVVAAGGYKKAESMAAGIGEMCTAREMRNTRHTGRALRGVVSA